MAISYIENLTRVIISYNIYETSLQRVLYISYEMTTSIRFCLSYDVLKWDLFTITLNNLLIRKRIVGTDVVNDATQLRKSAIIARVVIRLL